MSLLGTPVYANPSTPLWLGVDGGVISGNLVVDGTLVVDGGIQTTTNVSAPSFLVIDPSGATTGAITRADAGAGAGLNFQGSAFKFGRVGTGNANTILTTSAFGANTDLLSVGGTMNCLIGPTPAQIITSTKSVASIAVSPASPSQFGVDTTITSISGAEYDVQMTGIVSCASGSVNAADYIVFNFTAGGSGNLDAIVFPGQALLGGNGVTGLGPLVAAGAGATVTLRARVVSGASGTTLSANVRAFLTGTAVYSAQLTVLDVQRVR
jgi:hypothetical protein